jgi:hypothetical protein
MKKRNHYTDAVDIIWAALGAILLAAIWIATP